jgi:hypothetical protein
VKCSRLSSPVVRLAQTIYNKRAFHGPPTLADTLAEAALPISLRELSVTKAKNINAFEKNREAESEAGFGEGKSEAQKEMPVFAHFKSVHMNIEIIEEPIRFNLHGISSAVENARFGAIGLRLMNEMWQVVKSTSTPTTGINHWVYLPNGRMFVGVELRNAWQLLIPDQLEPLEFELQRSMKHVHVGPYQALPQKWKELMAELAVRGEIIGSPSLEIYGHHCDDPAKLETTILVGLQAKAEGSPHGRC